jgi:hypothetical protein
MTDVVIKIEGWADPRVGCPHAGQYVKSYDFEAFSGRGLGVYTTNIKEALRFQNPAKALEFWRTVPKARPRNEYGNDNRPMTVMNIEILKA